MLKFLIAYLLHHANREGRDQLFYSVKKQLLKRYASFVCIDVQHIPGKICYTCNGSGQYSSHSECYHCNGTGFYKKEQWNLLYRYNFCGYIFHQPFARLNREPNYVSLTQGTITGYIEHQKSNIGWLAKYIIMFCYMPSYFNHLYSTTFSYKYQWYLPKNWLHNIFYAIKHRKAIVYSFIAKLKYFFSFKSLQWKQWPNKNRTITDDLPF